MEATIGHTSCSTLSPILCSSRFAQTNSRVSFPSTAFWGGRLRAASSAASASIEAQAQEQAQEQEQQIVEQLPPNLSSIVKLFQGVENPRDRYEQLMHYAKALKPLSPEHHSDENKVTGCVSQVWVRAWLGPDRKVYLEADSDSILTKGLAALLVQGLSGCSPVEIVTLTPDFIQMLGLKQSLTASRNNGFFNMFKLVQQKALQLHLSADGSAAGPSSPEKSGKEQAVQSAEPAEAAPAAAPAASTPSSRSQIIERKLREALSPSLLEVEDVSHQHAGHAAMRGTSGGETHFNVKVVSPQFEGRSLVKRHRLIYDLLDEELKSGLHALSIVAKTPAEINKQK